MSKHVNRIFWLVNMSIRVHISIQLPQSYLLVNVLSQSKISEFLRQEKGNIAFEKEVVENWAAYCIYQSTGVGYLSVSLELSG